MERHKIVHLNSVLKCNNKLVSSILSFSEDIKVVSSVYSSCSNSLIYVYIQNFIVKR